MKSNEFYFERERSIGFGTSDVKETLKILSNRYIANNPAKPLTAREFPKDNFLQEFSGRHLFNFDEKFPLAENGDFAYAFSYTFAAEEGPAVMGFRANTPAWVYMNGELIFETQSFDEGQYQPKSACFTLKQGVNTFLVKCKKNTLGFGCEFGSAGLQNGALVFLNPIKEQKGKRGWAYTGIQKDDIYTAPDSFPRVGEAAGELWLPKAAGDTLSAREIFGSGDGYVYFMSGLINSGINKKYTFSGSSEDNCRIFIDGAEVFSGNGSITFEKTLSSGSHIVSCQLKWSEGNKRGLDLKTDGTFTLDGFITDAHAQWLCLGVLPREDSSILENPDIYNIYQGRYWQTELGDDVRLSSESAFFGRWTYPLGVVLYGLNEAAEVLSDAHIKDYARSHIKRLSDSYEYALWDTEKYGRAALDYQLMMIDSLDYCGSCGNALLNVLDYNDNSVKKVADMIADFMENGQERLPNGMFYRHAEGSYQENTIWADDLYMSVPFLCRYYKATGDTSFLEDAVNQFKCFYEYLYMPDKKIMSHVYGLNYNKKNEIPWGRGNGWVVFALTELLAVLPENHGERDFLISFLAELCEGILSLQEDDGMWHQVIDEPSSYIESSCTSMFICAFLRGIRNGWLTDEKFAAAAFSGWRALCHSCIDLSGNLYGVCRGSMLSFRREYYLDELGWNLNDQHGTGIALLAGVEVLRMQELT